MIPAASGRQPQAASPGVGAVMAIGRQSATKTSGRQAGLGDDVAVGLGQVGARRGERRGLRAVVADDLGAVDLARDRDPRGIEASARASRPRSPAPPRPRSS